jgi:hypothetical protein
VAGDKRKVNYLFAMQPGFWGLPKSAMVGIIVVCLGLAVLIFYKFGSASEGPDLDVFEGELVWVKCANPDCKQAYQMDKKKYFEQVQKQTRQSPTSRGPILIVCEKCGKRNLFEVVKCGNSDCGAIFRRGAAGAVDFADRCPKCRYSQTEKDREEAASRRRR